MDQEELLSHTGFVRTLARSLVFDEHVAADVEQQTMLAALERQPVIRKSLRSWLSMVAHNIVRMRHRDDIRREKYKRTMPLPKAPLSPDEIVARGEAGRRLINAVLNLNEPYRSTILIRFYEDLSPHEIAELQCIPLATVRTRIHRGLAQLRQKLDAQHWGDRKKWLMAIAPIAGVKVTASAAGATPTIAAVLSGAFIMGTKLKIGLTIALLVGTLLTIRQILPDFQEPGELHNTHSDNSLAIDHGIPNKIAAEEQIAGNSSHKTRANDILALKPTGLYISGRVIDKISKGPVKRFDFEIRWFSGGQENTIQETFEDNEGRFYCKLEEPGNYKLRIASSQHRIITNNYELPEGQALADLSIELDPGVSFKGRVLEDATNRPVVNAIVSERARSLNYILLENRTEAYPNCVTDESGRFLLHGQWEDERYLLAIHPEFAIGVVEGPFEQEGEVEFRLKTGSHFFGMALDDKGEPIQGLQISVLSDGIIPELPTLTGSQGKYRTYPSEPGQYLLIAKWMVDKFTKECKRCELKDRDMEVNFGLNTEYATWYGTLYDYDGTVLAGSTVIASPDLIEGWQKKQVRYIGSRSDKTDKFGKFSISKILPGGYKVSIWIPNHGRYRSKKIFFDKPGSHEQDFHLSGGVIQGEVVDDLSCQRIDGAEGYVEAQNDEDRYDRHQVMIQEDGRFQFRGLITGTYALKAQLSGYAVTRPFKVRIAEGDILKDVQILVPSCGKLFLTFRGFPESDLRQRSVLFRHENNFESQGWISPNPDDMTLHHYSGILETGRWNLSISLRSRRVIVKDFTIHSDKTTKIILNREEYEQYDNKVTVDGRIVWTDGSPLANTWLTIRHVGSPSHVTQSVLSKIFKLNTDEMGQFFLSGLSPGKWSVQFITLNTSHLHSWPIPANPPQPYLFELILPESFLSGRVLDGRTYQPINSFSVGLMTTLHDITQFHSFGVRSHPEGRFILNGIPAGEYRLTVKAQGFDDFHKDSIRLTEDEKLDFGDIILKPKEE